MAGQVLTTMSQIKCTHGGTAILTTANAKAMADNAFALLESDIHAVAGCPFTLPGGKYSPCVKIEWTAGATKMSSNGTKILVRSSVGKCINAENAPQGVAIIATTQMKTTAI